LEFFYKRKSFFLERKISGSIFLLEKRRSQQTALSGDVLKERERDVFKYDVSMDVPIDVFE